MVADTKTQIAARLDEAFTLMGYPPSRGRHQKIADAFKVSRETVRKWIEGEAVPEVYRLSDIAYRSGLSFEYLATGRTNLISEAMPPAFNNYVYVRRIAGARLSAGAGEIAWDFEEVDHSHSFRREWMQEMGLNAERCALWTVKGSSMEPNYNHDDVVLVNMANRTPIHGKVFGLVGDDGPRIKRLIRNADKHWSMRSDNEDKARFPDEPIIEDNYVVFGSIEWKAGRAV